MIWANKNIILFFYALEADESESSFSDFLEEEICNFFFPLLIL